MIQEIIIGAIFLAALVYVGRLVYKTFLLKHGCASGCGKCAAVDFEKIEKQISAKLAVRE